MSTMRIFREILFVKQQMETADAREVTCLSHKLAELRGAHANAINADVLVEIFSWLPLPNFAYPSKSDAPLNVSHVCRTWRYSAVSNSALWAKLYFYAQKDLFSNWTDSTELSKMIHPRIEAAVKAWSIWLTRSRSSPLRIKFDLTLINLSSDDYKEIFKLLSMTLSHQRRWKYIDIDFSLEEHDVAFTMSDMPLLEALSVRVNYERANPVGSYAFGLTWNDFIQTVRFSPQLKYVEELALPVDDVRDTAEVVLPMVCEAKFELAETQPRALSHALGQLTMPNLESLNVTVYDTDTTANCPLTSLSLCPSSNGHPGSDDTIHVLDLLSTVPELRHLCLEIHDLDDTFLLALTITPDSADFESGDNLCPKLESIDLPDESQHRGTLRKVSFSIRYLLRASSRTQSMIFEFASEGLVIEFYDSLLKGCDSPSEDDGSPFPLLDRTLKLTIFDCEGDESKAGTLGRTDSTSLIQEKIGGNRAAGQVLTTTVAGRSKWRETINPRTDSELSFKISCSRLHLTINVSILEQLLFSNESIGLESSLPRLDNNDFRQLASNANSTMSTMATFREIVAVRKQMESRVADARELKRLSHRLAELRGMHASGINADILAQIISWLPLPNLAYSSNTDAPLNVSQVCRTWRYSTVSNSALWANLSFYAQKDPSFDLTNSLVYPEVIQPRIFIQPRIEAAVKAWAIWLARSCSSPLFIRLDPNLIVWTSDEHEGITKLLVMTLSHQRRWKHIDIGFPQEYYDMKYTMCDMPLLEKLSVDVQLAWAKPAGRVCLDLSCSPRLRELRMSDICYLHDPTPTFGKLNKLSIRNRNGLLFGPTWKDFIQTARFAPQLQFIEKLILYVANVRDTTEVVLPMVREARFELVATQPRALRHALSQLTIPNLESLDITVYGTHIAANGSSLFISIKSLILRSKCPLTSLSLCPSPDWRYESDDTTHVLDLLSMIPELRHLSLRLHNLGDAFLHALTITPGSSVFEPEVNLCPGLESISFAGCRHFMTSEGFCQMVASRWRAGGTLRKVSVSYMHLDLASSQTRSMINGFLSEGLAIESDGLDLKRCGSPLEYYDSSSKGYGSPFPLLDRMRKLTIIVSMIVRVTKAKQERWEEQMSLE
ncbi:hypothetical protein DFH11DRAFT_1798468 [Phellopilus nigrolimitatus]|nr:hypothetical protein DFH11DRAFT_1798468 [Phellopilus nigrolimitatus]